MEARHGEEGVMSCTPELNRKDQVWESRSPSAEIEQMNRPGLHIQRSALGRHRVSRAEMEEEMEEEMVRWEVWIR